MLIRPVDLRRIREGEIDLAFRRWDRARLLVGTRMRTSVGLVEVTSVDRITEAGLTAAEARRAGAASRAELLAQLAPKKPAPIWRIGVRFAGADPRIALRAEATLADGERDALHARLRRLDAASAHGPWTHTVLELIAASPGRRAPDLAHELGRDTQPFKRDVRKLKELGLTESLDVGYRISPRGQVVLDGWAGGREGG